MSEDDVRKMLAEAHGGDRAPPITAVLDRSRGHHVRGLPLALVGLGAAGALYALGPTGRGADAQRDGGLALAPAAAVAMPAALDLPLDFLLEVPRAEWLRAAPQFDPEGALP